VLGPKPSLDDHTEEPAPHRGRDLPAALATFMVVGLIALNFVNGMEHVQRACGDRAASRQALDARTSRTMG
jgi:hypothetical protein